MFNSVFGLPPDTRSDVQVFHTTGDGSNFFGLQTWQKPKGASMVFILAVSGGGGGGGGWSRSAGNNGGGGGSGACAGFTKLLLPAILCPDKLYVLVGQGGQGGAAAAAGSAGGISFITTSLTNAIPNRLMYASATQPGGGNPGQPASPGGAGSIPSIGAVETPGQWGFFSAIVGIAGQTGGTHTGAVGTSITAWAVLPQSPGASGAGCNSTDFAGGAQTATALLDCGNQMYVPAAAGGLVAGGTAAGTGVNGGSGIKRLSPFFNSGGAGGGSNNSGQAGHGGAGGYGCGGGGGGAGTTAGRGGNGGDGIVIFISW